MRLLLIDDHGELWPENSKVLRKSFASKMSRDGISAYLVKNLGFVAVDSFGASAQVRVRPAILTPAAIDTLLAWMRTVHYERIALAYFDTDWRFILVPSVEALAARLDALMTAQAAARPAEFITRASDVATLAHYPALQSLIDNWEKFSRELSDEALARIVRQLTRGRYVIVKRDASNEHLVMSEAGTGYRTMGKDWAMAARGAPVAEQPDAAYGAWLSQCYERALALNEPIVEDVDAIVTTPEYGRYRLRYKRLMLTPRGTNSDCLLCSSVLDDRIDLRVTAL